MRTFMKRDSTDPWLHKTPHGRVTGTFVIDLWPVDLIPPRGFSLLSSLHSAWCWISSRTVIQDMKARPRHQSGQVLRVYMDNCNSGKFDPISVAFNLNHPPSPPRFAAKVVVFSSLVSFASSPLGKQAKRVRGCVLATGQLDFRRYVRVSTVHACFWEDGHSVFPRKCGRVL